jgi:alanine racemase
MQGLRATRAFIDLDAIAGNVRAVRAILPPTTAIMAIVKADAYGHGAPWVAECAVDAGAASLGVATVGEVKVLREAGIGAPIVLLGSIDPVEAEAACLSGVEITVADLSLLEAVQRAARKPGATKPIAVHLKIDSGLRRYGVLPEQAAAIASRIAADPNLAFTGVCTHFASADEPADPFTDEQLRRFHHTVALIRDAGVPTPRLHVANSAAILTGRATDLDMVRLGIALYGVRPSAEVPLLPAMRPAMRLESRVTRIIPLSAGDSVGYNRTYCAETAARGALVPLGYADGFRRSLSNRGWVGIGGTKAPVLGRVSMDQTVVGIPPAIDATVGDIVQVLGGESSGAAPSIDEMAALMDTNSYEVLVGIRQRVPRIFTRGGEPVAVRTIEGD